MAREKGTGSLQLEKSGRWTMRVGIKGKRNSRSTRTTDRDYVLRQAVAAIPTIGSLSTRPTRLSCQTAPATPNSQLTTHNSKRGASVPARLKRLDKYLAQGLITRDEHAVLRERILGEL